MDSLLNTLGVTCNQNYAQQTQDRVRHSLNLSTEKKLLALPFFRNNEQQCPKPKQRKLKKMTICLKLLFYIIYDYNSNTN